MPVAAWQYVPMKIFNARFPSIASATLLALATLGFSFHQYYFCRTLSSLKRDIDRHRQSMTASLEYGYHAGNDARYARELRNHVEILKALNSDSRLIESRKAEMVDELKNQHAMQFWRLAKRVTFKPLSFQITMPL